MKRVSFQGTTLSASQRRQLDLQARMKAVTVSPLHEQVQETLRALDERKEQGVKPDQQYFLVSKSSGTPSVAEWMGF